MTPIKNRIFVLEDAPPDKIGRIHIPRVAKPQTAHIPTTGIVKGVGPEVKDLKEGDRVIFSRLSPMMTIEHLKYLIMNEEDVLGKIEEEQ
jgi:co-chaperonin GroES (HSP10)